MTLQEKIAHKQLHICIETFEKLNCYNIKTYTAFKLVDNTLVHKVFEIEFHNADQKAIEVARVRKEINKGTWTNVVFASEVWTSENGYRSPSADPDREQAIMICSEEQGKSPLVLILGINEQGLSGDPLLTPVVSGELLVWPFKETIN